MWWFIEKSLIIVMIHRKSLIIVMIHRKSLIIVMIHRKSGKYISLFLYFFIYVFILFYLYSNWIVFKIIIEIRKRYISRIHYYCDDGFYVLWIYRIIVHYCDLNIFLFTYDVSSSHYSSKYSTPLQIKIIIYETYSCLITK